MKDKRIKKVFINGGYQWEGEGNKKTVNEDVF
jgi:hypothetical protein